MSHFIPQSPLGYKPTPPQSAPLESHTLPIINIETHSLPSKGLAYPANCQISYHPYTFGEIKQISQSKFTKSRQQFEVALKGVNCSFNPFFLTIPDAVYLLMLRSISSVKGTGLVFNTPCDVCGKNIHQEIKLDQIEFFDLNLPNLPIIADIGGKELEFYPAMLQDLFFLEELGEGYDTEIAMFAIQCKNLAFEEAYKFIYGVSDPEDFRLLQEVDKELLHGVKPVSVRCLNVVGGVKCNFTKELEVQGGQALVLPFRGDEKSTERRIRYGIQATHTSTHVG